MRFAKPLSAPFHTAKDQLKLLYLGSVDIILQSISFMKVRKSRGN